METLGVLLTYALGPYLESQLHRRCNLLRLWTAPRLPPLPRELNTRAGGKPNIGADAETIYALPRLEIVSSFSVGIDKVDLAKCRERGIRVTNTPGVLPDDVADLANGLAIAILRHLSGADWYVRGGEWRAKGEYRLTARFGITFSVMNLTLEFLHFRASGSLIVLMLFAHKAFLNLTLSVCFSSRKEEAYGSEDKSAKIFLPLIEWPRPLHRYLCR